MGLQVGVRVGMRVGVQVGMQVGMQVGCVLLRRVPRSIPLLLHPIPYTGARPVLCKRLPILPSSA